MSAEALRRAAALMRERAEAATPGPWRPQGDKVRGTSADSLIEDNILIAYAGAHYQRLGMTQTGRGNPVPEHAPDVQHFASWHPAVAHAVADLLCNEANLIDGAEQYPDLHTPLNAARTDLLLAVARAYLGESAS